MSTAAITPPLSEALTLANAVLDTPFSMAFQPIVDISAHRTVAFEALVRGPHNEPAAAILSSLREADSSEEPLRYFACNLEAIQTAARLGIARRDASLFLNINPASELDPARTLGSVVDTAAAAGLPLRCLVLEITETEPLRSPERLASILAPLRAAGLRIALDDFGSGFSGLLTLASFPFDIIKLDRDLIRPLAASSTHRTIVGATARMCRDLNIDVLAEGIETPEQQRILTDFGIRLMQGNYFAEPAFQALPAWPSA